MRGFSWKFVCSGGILTIFCLLEVLASEDAQPLENSNSNLTNILTENLDGHVELSTLDLLPTTDPTHHAHQRKVLRYVMKRPIHRNSTSKINRKEHFSVHTETNPSSQVGFEKNSGDDREVLTDTSKAYSAANDEGDKHQVIDEKYKNNDVEGGNSVEKGSETTGSTTGDKDVQTKKVYELFITKRPIPIRYHTFKVPSQETTTYPNGQNVSKKGRRRKFLENKPHLKHKNHLENYSEATTSISGLSLVLEATDNSSANRTSEYLHEMDATTTEKTEEKQIDLSSHVYPDQDILFTHTGPENDESLFEFTGSTEQDIFGIGQSEQQNVDHPLKKITVSLPKSFSEKESDNMNDVENSEGVTLPTDMTTSFSYFTENTSILPLVEPTEIYLGTDDSLIKITQVDTTTVSPVFSNQSSQINVENVTDTIHYVPRESLSQDTESGITTETTQSSTKNVTIFEENSRVVPNSTTTTASSTISEATENISHNITALEDKSDSTTTLSSVTSGKRKHAHATDTVTVAGGITLISGLDATTTIESAIDEENIRTPESLQSSTRSDVTFSAGLTTEPTVPNTEEMVTVIQVHPDTTKSGSTTTTASSTISEATENILPNITAFEDESDSTTTLSSVTSETRKYDTDTVTVAEGITLIPGIDATTTIESAIEEENISKPESLHSSTRSDVTFSAGLITEPTVSNPDKEKSGSITETTQSSTKNVTIAEENSTVVPNSTTTTASSTISEATENISHNITAPEDESDSTTPLSSVTSETREHASDTVTVAEGLTLIPGIDVTTTIEPALDEENISTAESLQSSTRSDLTFSAELTTEPTVPNAEEMVTVDPSHWYGISNEEGIIKVHSDTEKSENITDVFEDQQIPTKQDIGTTETSVEATTTEEAEEIVTVDPSQWYGITGDDGTINEVPDTSNDDVTAKVSENEVQTTTEIAPVEQDTLFNLNTIGKENGEPVPKPKVKTSYRSDKALPLPDTETDNENDMIYNNRSGDKTRDSATKEISELSTFSTTSTYSTEAGPSESYIKDEATTSSFDSSNTILGNITTVFDQSSEERGTTEYDSSVHSIDTLMKGTQFTSSSVIDHTEDSTKNSITSVLTHEENEQPILMNMTRLSDDEVYDKDAIESTSDFGDAVEDIVTEAVVDSNSISSHSSEDINIGTEQTTDIVQNETINSSTVKDMNSVVILNEENGFKEYTTKANEKEEETTESFTDSFKENLVPTEVKFWINSDEHVLNIVDSDEKETDQEFATSTSSKNLSNKIDESEKVNAINRNKENATSQKEMFLNKNRTVEPMMQEGEHFFENESAYIVRNILGNPANVSIHIQIEDEFEYIPSDVYILEDLENQLLNFTWISANNNINNSLALSLNRTENVYMISTVYLNILKGGAILYLKKDIKSEPQLYNRTKNFNFIIDLSYRNKVTFSNVDFLRIPIDETPNKNIRTGIQQSSEERQNKGNHMEIVIGVIIIVAVLLIIIFLLVEKRRRKTVTKTIDSDKNV
ncbi:unnamed protein product [Phaedon cochleariae]|uniref:Uncharacterized protein n=1 Tax=Phaedon cochleariae TaxID=80249 RepID=A0A9P0DNH1_PHACE|nr:unnamed protein product [Phaedon cochleariae]